MRVTVETSIPVDYVDPNSFIRPVLIKVYSLDEEGQEWLVGQLYADMIFVELAQLHGHPMIYVFDCDGWDNVYEAFFDEKEEWRPELTFEDPIEKVLIFYRVFLAPCTESFRREIFSVIFRSLENFLLVGIWRGLDVVSTTDLVSLGFAKLSSLQMVVKHNALKAPFDDETFHDDFPYFTASKSDEDWVQGKIAEQSSDG